jgi:hypothetical protein
MGGTAFRLQVTLTIYQPYTKAIEKNPSLATVSIEQTSINPPL